MSEPPAAFEGWLAALDQRHRASLTTQELTRALRALSVRYLQKRAALPDRSPLDSAGKRAAFALFYAALHYLTTMEVVGALGAAAPLDRIVDLGCGTGVASAAWAAALPTAPALSGVDGSGWALDEARWNWRVLGLQGQARRGDMVDAASRLARDRTPAPDRLGVIAGWSVNELDDSRRAELLDAVSTLAGRGSRVLVIEPLAKSVTPWWSDWVARLTPEGWRADEWKFPVTLPPVLAILNHAAGFNRQELGARSLTHSSS